MKSSATLALSLATLSIAMGCPALGADPYYRGTPYTPYPPGCATLHLRQSALYQADVHTFWTGSLTLEVVAKVNSADESKNLAQIEMAMSRVACAEPNRSLIMVQFRLPSERVDPRLSQLVLPTFFGNTGFHAIPFELGSEANSWGQSGLQQALTRRSIGDYTGGWVDASWFTWNYILDIGPPGQAWDWPGLIDYYNAEFGLLISRNGEYIESILVPATLDAVAPSGKLPLNGRLSGRWVEQGVADQEIRLSFGTHIPLPGMEAREPENADLVLMFTWYTYGSDGNMLWLTGSARFPQGASEVSMAIERAGGGKFMGGATGAGKVVGNATIKAKSCDDLVLEYDLGSLSLGSGEMNLRRSDALEIAGYNCRDYLARRDSLLAQPRK